MSWLVLRKHWPCTTDAISTAPAATSAADGWLVATLDPSFTTPQPAPSAGALPTLVDGINGDLVPGWIVANGGIGGGGGPAVGGGNASTCNMQIYSISYVIHWRAYGQKIFLTNTQSVAKINHLYFIKHLPASFLTAQDWDGFLS